MWPDNEMRMNHWPSTSSPCLLDLKRRASWFTLFPQFESWAVMLADTFCSAFHSLKLLEYLWEPKDTAKERQRPGRAWICGLMVGDPPVETCWGGYVQCILVHVGTAGVAPRAMDSAFQINTAHTEECMASIVLIPHPMHLTCWLVRRIAVLQSEDQGFDHWLYLSACN